MKKFNNTKITIDNIKFDSLMESDYYVYLKNMKSQGNIKDFSVHPKYTLQPSFVYKQKTIRPITYTSDFLVENNDGSYNVVDVKGVKTNEFKLKEKMLKYILKDDNNYNIMCVKLHKNIWITI